MQFKRFFLAIFVLIFTLISVSPAQPAVAADTTNSTQSTISQMFGWDSGKLSEILEFTYNGEPFKTPDSYVNDSTIPFMPLYFKEGNWLGFNQKYKILTMDRLLDSPENAADRAIYIKIGKDQYSKVATLDNLSLDPDWGTFNSMVFAAQYARYKNNLIKDNKGEIKDLIVALDGYGNLVTNNKQIIVPFYNNPIVTSLAYGGNPVEKSEERYIPDGIGKLATKVEKAPESKVSSAIADNSLTNDDLRYGFVLTAGMMDSNIINDVVNRYGNYLKIQSAFSAYNSNTRNDPNYQLNFYRTFNSPQVWDLQFYDKSLVEYENGLLTSATSKTFGELLGTHTTTSLGEMAYIGETNEQLARNAELQIDRSPLNGAIFNGQVQKKASDLLKRSPDNYATNEKVMNAIFERYKVITERIFKNMTGDLDKAPNDIPYAYLPYNFGIASAGKVTYDQMADTVKKQDGIIDMVYTYLSFGVWNMIKFTYTALGQEVYTKVFLGHSGNALFYTPTPNYFTFVKVATAILYVIMAALCIFKMGFDLFRIAFGGLTVRKYILGIFTFIFLFALPLLFYNNLLDFTFNKTNESFIRSNLYQTAILDRSITFDKELVSKSPTLSTNLDFRDPLENYALQIPIKDETGKLDGRAFGLFDFLDYARNRALTMDRSDEAQGLLNQQVARGFIANNYGDNLIGFVKTVGLNDDSKKFYKSYDKYVEMPQSGDLSATAPSGEKKPSDIFTDIYYQYMVKSQFNALGVATKKQTVKNADGTTSEVPITDFATTSFLGNNIREQLENVMREVNFDFQDNNGAGYSQQMKDLLGLSVDGAVGELRINNNIYTQNLVYQLQEQKQLRIKQELPDRFIITYQETTKGTPVKSLHELETLLQDGLKLNMEGSEGQGLESMLKIDDVIKKAAEKDPFRLGVGNAENYDKCAANITSDCGILLNDYRPYLVSKGIIELTDKGFHFTGLASDTDGYAFKRDEKLLEFNGIATELNYKLIEDFRKYHMVFSALQDHDDFVQAESEFLALNTFFTLNNYFELDKLPQSFYTAGISTDTFLRILMIPMSQFSATNTDINNVMAYVGMHYDPITFLVTLINIIILFTAYSVVKVGVISVAFPFLIVLASVQTIWYKGSKSFVGLGYIFGTFYLIHLGFLSLWKLFTFLNNRYHNFNNDFWLAAPELITSICFLAYYVLVWKFLVIPLYKNVKSDLRNLGGASFLAQVNKAWNRSKDWINQRKKELGDRFRGSDGDTEGDDVSANVTESKDDSSETISEELRNTLKPQNAAPSEADPAKVEELNSLTEKRNEVDESDESNTETGDKLTTVDGMVPPIISDGVTSAAAVAGSGLALGSPAVAEAAKNIMESLGHSVDTSDEVLKVTGLTPAGTTETLSKVATGLEEKATTIEQQADSLKVNEVSETLHNSILKQAETSGLVTTSVDENGKMSYELAEGTSEEDFQQYYNKELIGKVQGGNEQSDLQFVAGEDGSFSLVNGAKTRFALDELEKSGMITGYSEENGRLTFTPAAGVSEDNLREVMGGINNMITTSSDDRYTHLNEQQSLEDITYVSGDESVIQNIVSDINNNETVASVLKESTGYDKSDNGTINLQDNSVTQELLEQAGLESVAAVDGNYILDGTNAELLDNYLASGVQLDYRRTIEDTDGGVIISANDELTASVLSSLAEKQDLSLRGQAGDLRSAAQDLRDPSFEVTAIPVTSDFDSGLFSKFSFTLGEEMGQALRQVLNEERTPLNSKVFDDVRNQLADLGVTKPNQIYRDDDGNYNIMAKLGSQSEQVETLLSNLHGTHPTRDSESREPSLNPQRVSGLDSISGLGNNPDLTNNSPRNSADQSVPDRISTVDILADLAGDDSK